jgi:hypothetical protein
MTHEYDETSIDAQSQRSDIETIVSPVIEVFPKDIDMIGEFLAKSQRLALDTARARREMATPIQQAAEDDEAAEIEVASRLARRREYLAQDEIEHKKQFEGLLDALQDGGEPREFPRALAFLMAEAAAPTASQGEDIKASNDRRMLAILGKDELETFDDFIKHHREFRADTTSPAIDAIEYAESKFGNALENMDASIDPVLYAALAAYAAGATAGVPSYSSRFMDKVATSTLRYLHG